MYGPRVYPLSSLQIGWIPGVTFIDPGILVQYTPVWWMRHGKVNLYLVTKVENQ